MVESTAEQSGPRGSEVIKQESTNCQIPINILGMPTVWHLHSNQIGVVHPFRAGGVADEISYMLTVYDWINGDLTRTAHIRLWDTPMNEKLFMINMMNYDVEHDHVTVIFSNIYVPFEPAVRMIEFNLTNAID